MNTFTIQGSKKTITYWILTYTMLMCMFIRYVEHARFWEIGIIICVVYLFAISKKYAVVFRSVFFFSILSISILLYICSSIKTFNIINILTNSEQLFFPIIIATILLSIALGNPRCLSDFLVSKWWLFNIFWIVNLIVVYLQINGHHIFIKKEWLDLNDYYPDLCAGLFGFNGTHKLTAYSCFILIYNLAFAKIWRKNKSKIIIVYTAITEGIMLYLSVGNENLMIYILLPLCFGLYWLFELLWSKRTLSKKTKRILIAIFMIVVVVLFVVQLPIVQQKYLPVISQRINKVLFYRSAAYDLGGSNERLAIAGYALSKAHGWLIGAGIGAAKWAEEGAFGFQHYGLNSLGTIINLGGIWFFLILVLLYTYIATKLAYNKHKKHMLLYGLLCGIIIFVFTVCTIPFTDITLMTWIVCVFVIMGEIHKYYEHSNNYLFR